MILLSFYRASVTHVADGFWLIAGAFILLPASYIIPWKTFHVLMGFLS
jgi:hypothetical protein